MSSSIATCKYVITDNWGSLTIWPSLMFTISDMFEILVMLGEEMLETVCNFEVTDVIAIAEKMS